MNAVMKEVKRRMGVKFLEEGRKCRLPGLLYTDDLVLYGKLEKNLRAMVGQFVEMCKRSESQCTLEQGDGFR